MVHNQLFDNLPLCITDNYYPVFNIDFDIDDLSVPQKTLNYLFIYLFIYLKPYPMVFF